MSFLDEKKKSGKRPDYADVDMDGNRKEPMAKAFKDKENAQNEEKGYGRNPETGEITPMSSDNAISNWLKKIMSDIDNKEGNIEEDKKTIELPANTTFTLDLKHLMKKHIDEGKSVKGTLTLTKALMKKLHDRGKVKVDGTKVIFKENLNKEKYLVTISVDGKTSETYEYDNEKDADDKAKQINTDYGKYGFRAVVSGPGVNEADVPMDMPVDLPKPKSNDFLGPDGKDYEGGMAKSQMLKMKNYAKALCDMIEDESQLEAWVQAKLTKASDYMSAVYHYLDYQRSKMNEEEEFIPLTKQQKNRLINTGGLKPSELPAYEKFLKDNPDLPDSMPEAVKAFKSKMNEEILNENQFTPQDYKKVFDEIKNEFNSDFLAELFFDGLEDEDIKEFLDLINSNAPENDIIRLIKRKGGDIDAKPQETAPTSASRLATVDDKTLDRFKKEFDNPNPSGPPYPWDLIEIRKLNFKRFLEKANKDGFFIPQSMPIAINLWKGKATEEKIRLLNKKNGDFAIKWYNDYKDGKYNAYLSQDASTV